MVNPGLASKSQLIRSLVHESTQENTIGHITSGVNRLSPIVGFLGYPQPGGGTHPPIPREGVLGKVLGDWADLALR